MLGRVDTPGKRIDAHLFLIVGHLPVAVQRAGPVLVAGLVSRLRGRV